VDGVLCLIEENLLDTCGMSFGCRGRLFFLGLAMAQFLKLSSVKIGK